MQVAWKAYENALHIHQQENENHNNIDISSHTNDTGTHHQEQN